MGYTLLIRKKGADSKKNFFKAAILSGPLPLGLISQESLRIHWGF